MRTHSSMLDQLSQEIIDRLPVIGILATVPHGRILRFNRKTAEWCGDTGMDCPLWERLHVAASDGGNVAVDTDCIATALRTGSALRDVDAVLEGLREIPVSVSIEPIRGPNGDPIATFTVCQRTERWKHALAALHRNEARMRLALQAARVETWELDLGTRSLKTSPRCKANLGRSSADELRLDAHILPSVEAEHREAILTAIDRAIATTEAFQTEVALHRPDGGRHRLLVKGRVVDPRCMLGISLELDSQRQSAVAPDDNAARYKEIVETANEGIWTLDEHAKITFVNDRMANFLGKEAAGMVGRYKWDFGFTEDIAFMKALFERRRQGIAEEVMDIRFRHRDGHEVWTLMAARPRHDRAGRFIGALDLFTDITKRRHAEQALREREAQFRTLADNISQLTWIADGKGAVFWCNRRWLEYTGGTVEDLQGRGWCSAVHPDHLQAVGDMVGRCFDSGETWEATFPLRASDGSYRWFLSRGVPVRGEEGDITCWLGTHTDIDKERRTNESLLAADRSKDEFITLLAHELRIPIGVIVNAIELLETRGAAGPSQQRLRDTIRRQTVQQLRLVDDLLDAGRIITGKLHLDLRVVDVGVVLKEAVDASRWCLDQRDHELEVDLPDSAVYVEVDPGRMVQVISNLVHNAAKYMEEGGRIRLRAFERDGYCVIEVRDWGLGISPNMLERIFERFVQVENHRGGAYRGLGLGLSLVKAIVQLHGGNVEACSEGVGKGSEFTVRIPVAAARRVGEP